MCTINGWSKFFSEAQHTQKTRDFRRIIDNYQLSTLLKSPDTAEKYSQYQGFLGSSYKFAFFLFELKMRQIKLSVVNVQLKFLLKLSPPKRIDYRLIPE